ncbi:E3 SUMO-protein ligase ZBED1 [Labeo rohita]|uniref:E3 SUMO-protein ligase ZBED1 n=1 Tax=Labeo rohita TaxID=84645 RepID=A0ABQ8MS95_LABRO|nr:E3 SUMO-protein ligase ZBED1 [Labeo rohita]
MTGKSWEETGERDRQRTSRKKIELRSPESGGGQLYISFTIHYLTPDWQLESNCLETQFFPEDHSAHNISQFFENMLEEWGTNRKDLGFSRSWRRRRELRENQAALNMPQKALIHDVVTRWGSTYKMVECFLSQQQPVCATLAGERGAWHLMSKDTEITVMEQLCQLFESLSKLTDALALETRVTLSAIKPVLDHINCDILVEKDTDTSLTKEMKNVMREDLKNRYTDKEKRVMNMACFIDPHFKRSSLDESETSKTDTDCVQEAVKLAAQVREKPQSTSTSSSTTSSTPTAASEGKGLAGSLRKITSTTRQQRGEDGQIPTTLEEENKSTWRGHASELPHPARKLLCIPATSMPSERVFSTSGHFVSPQRALLKPDKRMAVTVVVVVWRMKQEESGDPISAVYSNNPK